MKIALAAMHANMRAFYRLLGERSPGGTVVERDGILAAVVPSCPNRSIVNAVVYEDAGALAAIRDELEASYDRAGVRAWTVWVPEADRAAAQLGALGEQHHLGAVNEADAQQLLCRQHPRRPRDTPACMRVSHGDVRGSTGANRAGAVFADHDVWRRQAVAANSASRRTSARSANSPHRPASSDSVEEFRANSHGVDVVRPPNDHAVLDLCSVKLEHETVERHRARAYLARSHSSSPSSR